jgi:hypothetical protein
VKRRLRDAGLLEFLCPVSTSTVKRRLRDAGLLEFLCPVSTSTVKRRLWDAGLLEFLCPVSTSQLYPPYSCLQAKMKAGRTSDSVYKKVVR